MEIDRQRIGRTNNRRARAKAPASQSVTRRAIVPTPAQPPRARDAREDTAWFKLLPSITRAEILRAWRADAARNVELERRVRRRVILSSVQMSALFAIGDVVCPYGSLATFALALAIGALLGTAGELVHANRLVNAIVGLTTFFMLQWLSRSGLTALHMLIFFPFGSMCAYLGYLREEPDWV